MPKEVLAKIRTLDAVLECTIHSNTTTIDLLEFVSKTIGVSEIGLFGLQYKDRKGFLTWMRLNKKVLSHDIGKQSPLLLHFAIRFYPEDVDTEIKTQPTLQLLFLQSQAAILNEEINCTIEKAVDLACYTCQAAMGDFSEDKPRIRCEKLMPRGLACQQEELVPKIKSLWMRCHGMDRDTAMMNYLRSVQQLEMFGISYFKVKNKKGVELLLGVHSKGLQVREKVNEDSDSSVSFQWNDIKKIDCREKKFIIRPANPQGKEKTKEHLDFYTDTRRKNRHIFGLCLGNHELFIRRRITKQTSRVISKSQSEVVSWDEDHRDALGKTLVDGKGRPSLSDDEGDTSYTFGSTGALSERSGSTSSDEHKTPVPEKSTEISEDSRPTSTETSEHSDEETLIDRKRNAEGNPTDHELEVKKMKNELLETRQEMRDFFIDPKQEETEEKEAIGEPEQPEEPEEWNKPVEGYLLMQVPVQEDEEVIPVQAVQVVESSPEFDEEDCGDLCRKEQRNIDADKLLHDQIHHFDQKTEPLEGETLQEDEKQSNFLPDFGGILNKAKTNIEDLFKTKEDEDSDKENEKRINRGPYVEEYIEKAEKDNVVESDQHDYFSSLELPEPEHRERQRQKIQEEQEVEPQNDDDDEEDDDVGDGCKKKSLDVNIDKVMEEQFENLDQNIGEPSVEQRSYELNQRPDSPSTFQVLLSKAKKGFEDLFSFGGKSDDESEDERHTGTPVNEHFEEETYIANVESERLDYFDMIDNGENPDEPMERKDQSQIQEEVVVSVDATEVNVESSVNGYFDDIDREEEMIFARMEASKREPVKEVEDIIQEDNVLNVESENSEMFNGFPLVQQKDYDVPDIKVAPEIKVKGKDVHQENFEKHRHNLEIMERMSNFESEVKKAMEAIERCEDIVKRVEELQRKTDDKMTVLTYL